MSTKLDNRLMEPLETKEMGETVRNIKQKMIGIINGDFMNPILPVIHKFQRGKREEIRNDIKKGYKKTKKEFKEEINLQFGKEREKFCDNLFNPLKENPSLSNLLKMPGYVGIMYLRDVLSTSMVAGAIYSFPLRMGVNSYIELSRN